jgi:hypothetical protein
MPPLISIAAVVIVALLCAACLALGVAALRRPRERGGPLAAVAGAAQGAHPAAGHPAPTAPATGSPTGSPTLKPSSTKGGAGSPPAAASASDPDLRAAERSWFTGTIPAELVSSDSAGSGAGAPTGGDHGHGSQEDDRVLGVVAGDAAAAAAFITSLRPEATTQATTQVTSEADDDG